MKVKYHSWVKVKYNRWLKQFIQTVDWKRWLKTLIETRVSPIFETLSTLFVPFQNIDDDDQWKYISFPKINIPIKFFNVDEYANKWVEHTNIYQ